MGKRRFLLGVCCLVFGAMYAQPVTIPGSQTRRFVSSIVPGQEYELQIQLPGGYGKTNKIYPVVYLMDSQWDFPLLTALYGQQYFDGFIPEVIIVGVTWSGRYSNPDSLRARDYTPSKDSKVPQSGGAQAFEQVLKKEVFPLIDNNYKVDGTNRTLAGCSLGGLFTLYILFTQPGLFQNYIAATPALGWDHEVLLNSFLKNYNIKTSRPARLYICEGGVERDAPLYHKFLNALKRKHKDITIRSEVLANIGHSGTKGIGYEHGLQFVFERASVPLPKKILDDIAGVFTSDNGARFTLNIERGKIILYFNEQNKYELLAASDRELYATSEFLNLHFHHTDIHHKTVILERYGSMQSFSKTN